MPGIGVIGGSGLYQMAGTRIVGEHDLSTPFGRPSDTIFEVEFEGHARAFFLPRHGRGHLFTPSEVNYRAIYSHLNHLV